MYQLTHEQEVTKKMLENFPYFISRANKLWRLENLYYIVTKDGKKDLFKLNRAQKHFLENYILIPNPYYRHIILKSRQLGFTTLINLFILDEIIFNQNKEGLVIAHTQKDATEIFNRKVKYAIRNLYRDIQDILEMDQSRSNRVQFVFPDESVSAFSVSNSGRSGTFNFLHISEFAKLCKAYPEKAREVILGTLPALSFDSFAFIESTAEGMNGDFYEMFDKSWKRKHLITPQVSKIEFYPHFYSWTWDDAEMKKIEAPIPIENMEECEINWGEYQKDNELSDIEITYYYYRFQQLGKDIDRLHQEYPTNHMEAFIGSGSNYYNLQKIYDFDTKADDNYTRYDYVNGEFIENDKGELYVYKKPEEGRRYVIGGDVAEGLQDGDYSTACVLGHDKEIKALYRGHMEPDDYSKMIQALGRWYNIALVAVEFNKDGNWVNTDMRNMGYPNLYVRTVIDDITKNETKMYGWVTNKKNRDFALGESKKHFNSTDMVNCKPLLDELKTFIRNKRGRPEAASGKHDDCFVKGTMITTENGSVPIEKLKIGDKVLTRDGYKKIEATRAKIKDVIGNIGLIGTPSHPVITVNGVKNLTDCKDSDKLYIWNSSKQKIEKLSYIKAKNFIGIQTQQEHILGSIFGVISHGKNLLYRFIDLFGKKNSEKLNQVFTSITKTVTHSIIDLRIWSQYQLLNTQNYICLSQKEGESLKKMVENKQKELLQKQINGGIIQKIKKTLKKMFGFLYTENLKKLIVYSVARSLFTLVNVVLPIVDKLVEISGEKRIVYNIQVEDSREYFANSILVHNCVMSWIIGLAILQGKQDIKEEKKTLMWHDLVFPKRLT